MAFPTTSIIDNFNRANEGPPLSSSWSRTFYATSGLEVVSNGAMQDDVNQVAGEYRNTGTYGPDSEAYITITTRATSGDYCTVWVDARLQDPNASTIDGYEVEMVMREGNTTVNIVRIWKIVNNSFSQLGSDINTTISNGDSFGIEVTGTGTVTIKAYHKPSGGSWGEIGSATDSSSPINSAGYIGIGIYDSGSAQTVLDDFGGGTVVAGGGTLSVTVSDSITVSENVTVAVETTALTVNLNDAVEVTDTPSAVLPNALAVNVADTVTVGENYDVALEGAPADLDVSVSDTVFVIEPSFVGFETPVVTVVDNVTVGESVTVILPDALITAVADAITLAENHVAEVVTTIAASEAVGVSESTSVSLPDALALAVSEAVSVSESVAVEPVTANVSLSEGVTVAEGVEAVLPDALVVDVSDGVTVTESASVNLPIAGTYTVNVNESIVTAESVSLTVSAPQVGAADTVGVAESAGAEVGGPQVNVSDAVTVGEGVALFVNEAGALGVNVSDGASLAEAVTLALNTLVIASQESIGLSEAASVLVMGSVIGGDATVAFSRASATTGIAKATASVEVK